MTGTGVLVVDDSRLVRSVVGDALERRDFEVVTASDGHEAVAAVHEHDPAVVTMDVEMPGMDGIEATERIMAEHPTPVVMLAADDAADATLAALASGAVDFVAKTGGQDHVDIADLEDDLVRTVEAVAGTTPPASTGTDDQTRPADDTEEPTQTATPMSAEAPATETAPADSRSEGGVRGVRADVDPAAVATRVARDAAAVADDGPVTTVVVGASTGGPGVVEALLCGLPAGIDARVLVVQHMPASFTGRLAVRLDDVSDYAVREATDGARLGPDEAVLAPGGRHLAVDRRDGEELVVALTDDEPRHNVRPAVDVTMESAAATHRDAPLVGAVLTGMGRDGAAGVEAVAAAGGTTLAQDRASSPVFGMPEQAIETGVVDRVVAAAELPAAVRDAVRDQQREHRREEAHA
jgi:two-component system chemotaxis response regulator CheB